MNQAPLIVHLIYRLDFGGLETLLVDCINRMPAQKYRHVIVCLSDYTDFSKKITQLGVELFALNKSPGLGLSTHIKLWQLLRRLKPEILHTYNLSAIEYNFTAALAGVPIRVHAEHGRDASDPLGKNPKHKLLRQLLTPFIDRYIPVSSDLQQWLKTVIGVPDAKNILIHNGVDTEHFSPRTTPQKTNIEQPHSDDCFVIGTVGRIQDVKNHSGLIDAFISLHAQIVAQHPSEKMRLRLSIVGDGPLLPAIRKKVEAAGIADLVWLPGARNDIAAILKTFNVFALPSIAEGTPVTILEAMASGLPIVATRVGGIPEVVADKVTGTLVAPADTAAFANALASYYTNPQLAAQHGTASRELVIKKNSMNAMVAAYTNLYDSLRNFKIKSEKLCAE